jgi:prepilin-type processing-associated H-X9-DG protein
MRTLVYLAITLGLASPAFGQADGKALPLPPDLAAVPSDAFLVAHVKLADLWKNDALKDVRTILQKAGPKALEALDKRFTPAPSTVERLTVYLPPPDFQNRPEFDPVVLVGVGKPYDQGAFLKQLGKTRQMKGRNGGFYIDEDEMLAVRFVDDRTLALGTVRAIQFMVDSAPTKKAGPLTPAIELARGNRPIVVGINTTAFPEEAYEELRSELPPPLHALLKAQSIIASLDLDGDGHLHARLTFPDKAAADAAERSIEAATDIAMKLIADTRKQLEERVFGDGKPGKIDDLPEAAASILGLGALQHAEDLLTAKPVKREGDAFAASVPLPPHFKSAVGAAAVAGSFLAPAIGRLREAAARAKAQNNLKQIGLAMHNYHDANNGFPPAAIVDKKGKPRLSWRVMILPYIEQDNLYREFKLDEPWDSEHNKKLIEKMPAVYQIPNAKTKPGHTHYRSFVGNGGVLDLINQTQFTSITDGTSNTWLVAETEEGVPWTKPDDIEFDPKKDLPAMGKFFKGGFNVAYCDGSVRYFKTVPNQAKAMITKDGGEVVTDE